MRWIAAAAAAALVLAVPAQAGEGKWTPQQVLEQGPGWVKAQGFGLPLPRLWDAAAGGGLLANAVQLPGCSGSFVSPEGLLITNHHCADGILQEHSTPQANLSRDGYLARSRAEEKQAGAYRVQVPRAFRDVTREVTAAYPKDADDLARFKAKEAQQKKLVAECEAKPATRCQFAEFDGGLFFTLTEFEELRDVRLVYAPPLAVGNYGGEVDNWSWPRHTGDFALLRAYKDGQPYRPSYFFPVATRGVREGDAVAVLGYPGRSYRSWIADEMQGARGAVLPDAAGPVRRVDRHHRGGERRLAPDGDNHRRRPAHARESPQERRGPDRRAAPRPDRREAARGRRARCGVGEGPAGRPGRARRLPRARGAERGAAADVAARLPAGPRRSRPARAALAGAAGAARHRSREAGCRARARLHAARPHAPARRARARPEALRRGGGPEAAPLVGQARPRAAPGQRIAAVDALFPAGADDTALDAAIASLYAASRVFDLAARQAMFDETPEALRARQDPLLALGFAIDAERQALKRRSDAADGATLLLRPAWRRAVIAEAGRPVAPDANGSLRVSFGRVRGYSPREAVTMSPHTTLAGAVAKHTGVEPFDLPASVREAYAQKRFGRWADPASGSVPIAMLADCDTTGGNSGSPTIDGEGRLVGVNFDRVWENVANDFGYNPDVARNVVADVRYLLWLLEDVEHADHLLQELGVSPR